MRRTTLMLLSIVCLMVLGSVLISRCISAQDTTDSVYFPYPPGILPPDLVPEIARVNREVNLIETEALAQWHALPINSGTAMRQVQILGKLELFDGNLLVNDLRSQKRWLRPSANPATYDQWGTAWNPNSLCVIECAAHHIHPERQLAIGVIYESS